MNTQFTPSSVLGLGPDDLGKRARFHMVTGIDMEGVIDALQPDPDWPLILIRDNDTITYLVADHVVGYTLYPATQPKDKLSPYVAKLLAMSVKPCDCPTCQARKGAVA